MCFDWILHIIYKCKLKWSLHIKPLFDQESKQTNDKQFSLTFKLVADDLTPHLNAYTLLTRKHEF